jgi:CRISPR-associated protein Cmr4
MYWQHALTPLHVGVGRGIGFIDLPIMREKLTNWPYVPGSSVKGVLRERAERQNPQSPLLPLAFGRGGDDDASSGSLVFTDARLVCLPVRSLYGTFAWATCPMALRRLAGDLKQAGLTDHLGIPRNPAEGRLLVPRDVASALAVGNDNKVLFEDLDFIASPCPLTGSWAEKLAGWVLEQAWQQTFRQRFAVVADEVFTFLCETATEVNARVRIKSETKTVEGGALWYEEALPAETILAGYVWCDRVYGNGTTPADLFREFCEGSPTLQIGGDATTGKGRVAFRFPGGGSSDA